LSGTGGKSTLLTDHRPGCPFGGERDHHFRQGRHPESGSDRASAAVVQRRHACQFRRRIAQFAGHSAARGILLHRCGHPHGDRPWRWHGNACTARESGRVVG